MSEKQEDKRLRETQLRIEEMMRNGWGGIDPQIVERFATNSPAGVMNEWGLRPGDALTQEQFDLLMTNLRGTGDPGSSNRGYIGAQNLTPEQYLADPRSAVRVENGQYVYRPELSAQATGGEDYFGINPSGFWNGAGPAMLAVALAGGLPMATSMGAFGAGAAAGGAEAGAAGAAGEFAGSFAPTITPSTVAQSGLLYTGGSMPTVAGLTGVGGLTAEGMAALGAMGSAGAGLGAGTTGALGSLGLDAAGNIVSQGVNLANSATTAAGLGSTAGGGVAQTVAQQAAKTGLSKVLKDTLGIDVDSSTLDLIGKAISTGVGIYGADKQADTAKDLFDQYMGMGAPYRAELANLNANPSSFYGSDIFQGALQQGSDALSRSLSAKVGNPILNPTALQEMQNYTTRGSLDAYNTRWNQLASAGQLGTEKAAGLGTIANNEAGNLNKTIGTGISSVFGPSQQQTTAGLYQQLQKMFPLP